MTVGWTPFKIIHSDNIMNLNNAGKAQPYLTVKHEIFPISENKLPVALRLTYRIHTLNDNKPVFSIIGEGKAVLEFEKGEEPTEELRRLINNFLLQIQLHWEDKTRNTKMYGQTIKPIPKENENIIIEDIIEEAKKSALL